MSAGAPMKRLVRIKRKGGGAWLGVFWAKRGLFSAPGLYVWTINRHTRVLPLPRRHYK